MKYKTTRKIDLANAYGVSKPTLNKMIEPIFDKIKANNKGVFFNVGNYDDVRIFLPAQTKAICQHLGECEDFTFVAYLSP